MRREHVWPKWLEDVIPKYSPQTHHLVADPDTPLTRQGTSKKRVTLTVNRVCEACNSGWMSDLETAARRIMVRPVEGRPSILDPVAQRTMATWAVKTAMAWSLCYGGSYPVPTEHYRWMRDNVEPPPNTMVLVAGYGGRRYNHLGVWKALEVVPKGHEPSEHANGYVATISAGHLVLQVLGTTFPLPERGQLGPGLRLVAAYLWPPLGRRIAWPPGPTLNDASLMALAEQAATGTAPEVPEAPEPPSHHGGDGSS
jgi:hypothetical protein